jgi:hypothetical protein
MTDDLPPLAPLHCVLEFLHTGDVGALRRAPRYGQNFDSETRARLFQHLCRSGARVRGNIDGAPATWIESLELINDFQVGYWRPTGLGQLACLESRIAYPADQVRDHSRPVQHPAAVTPNYRLVVLNAKVETAPLLLQAAHVEPVLANQQAIPAREDEQTRRARTAKGRQSRRGLKALNAEYPNEVSDTIATETVKQTCNAWLEKNEEKGSDGKIPKLPEIDVYARLLGRRRD